MLHSFAAADARHLTKIEYWTGIQHRRYRGKKRVKGKGPVDDRIATAAAAGLRLLMMAYGRYGSDKLGSLSWRTRSPDAKPRLPVGLWNAVLWTADGKQKVVFQHHPTRLGKPGKAASLSTIPQPRPRLNRSKKVLKSVTDALVLTALRPGGLHRLGKRALADDVRSSGL